MKKSRIMQKWLSLSIRYKINAFIYGIVIAVLIICIFFLGTISILTSDFDMILGDSHEVNKALVAFDDENTAFVSYSLTLMDEDYIHYQNAKSVSKLAIEALVLDYPKTGESRYLLTQAVQTAYKTYTNQCDTVLEISVRDGSYETEYYKAVDMASYISRYLQDLTKTTLAEGDARYAARMESMKLVPILSVTLSVVILALAMLLGTMAMRDIIRPVLRLADSAKQIADNNLDTPDIEVSNKDEIGQLVAMFNKMKGAMRRHIETLKEVNEMEIRLHQEELRQVEMEQQLKSMQLSMLQSQINPHFLFNTLNTIYSTAKIEGAVRTEELIQRLANLFRYNLQTSDAIVPLERELNIIQDYMYIQQRRFGQRLTFVVDNRVPENTVFIPVFTLQPIVENAVIHGVSKKVSGGSIRVKIYQKSNDVYINVTDTGLGISPEKLSDMLDESRQQQGHVSHIGIGNVRSRLAILFEGSQFKIFSRLGLGTSVRLVLPEQKEDTPYV